MNIVMYNSYNRAEVASSGWPLKALEDDVQDEGVGAVPTTLQAEIMPSGKKLCLVIVTKKLGCSWIKCYIGQIYLILPSTLFLPNTRQIPFHNLPQFLHFIKITHFVIYPNWRKSLIYLVYLSTLHSTFWQSILFCHLPCLCFHLVSLRKLAVTWTNGRNEITDQCVCVSVQMETVGLISWDLRGVTR